MKSQNLQYSEPIHSLPPGHERAMMSLDERLLLYALVYAFQPQRALEIGFAKGGSACIIAAAMHSRGLGQFVSIDPAPDIPPELARHPRFHCMCGKSPEAVPLAAKALGGTVDFCFIDGNHNEDQVYADSVAVTACLSSVGYILYHDSYYPPVARGIARFLKEYSDFSDGGTLARFGGHTNGEHYGGLRLLGRVNMVP